MKIPDVNLLLYAVNSEDPMHPRARKWLEDSLSDDEPFAFDWTVLLAFLRISTRPKIFARPLQPKQAFDVVRDWLNQPSAQLLNPGPRHLVILQDLIMPFGTGGNLISDVHLAALAIEYGATLYSADTDFARFPALSWSNPLELMP